MPRPPAPLRPVTHQWLPRAALVAVLVWFFWRHLSSPSYRGVFAGVNLVVHEAGHALFSWTGSTAWTVAGGTLLELAVPVGVAVLFLRQRDAFAVTVATFWLATALLGVSVYLGDARSQLLPLVTVGAGRPIHDWGYLLGRAGLLAHDRLLAKMVRDVGLLLMAGSVGGAVWIVWLIRQRARTVGDDRGAGPDPPDLSGA